MVDGVSYRLHKGRARNKMLGNAVPPPVGEYIGRRIIQHHMSRVLTTTRDVIDRILERSEAR
jgi:hypothetical protein